MHRSWPRCRSSSWVRLVIIRGTLIGPAVLLLVAVVGG
jgi:hypothetical protein